MKRASFFKFKSKNSCGYRKDTIQTWNPRLKAPTPKPPFWPEQLQPSKLIKCQPNLPMMKVIAVFCGVLSFLAGSVVGQPRDILGVTILSSQELKDGIDEGKCKFQSDYGNDSLFLNSLLTVFILLS